MDKKKLLHIAIIPDGNRRWARKKGMIATAGHAVAGKNKHLRALLEEGRRNGVKYMTFWGFSTENWRRNEKEIKKIFAILKNIALSLRQEARKNNIRCRYIGRKDRIPAFLAKELENLEEETKEFNGFYVNICIDYGGREEIVKACNEIIKECAGKINEEDFAKHLYTNGIPEPDLIIRTGGEQRTSGFMSFQSAYSEWYFTKTYFPDFNARELRKAIEEYEKRERRFGGK